MSNIGIKGLSTEYVLQGLEHILDHDPTQIGLFDVDWLALQENFSVNQRTSLFRNIYSNDAVVSYLDRKLHFVNKLNVLDSLAVTDYICELLWNELSKVLKMQSENIDIHIGIDSLGISSLLAFEFVANIEAKTGFRLSPVEILSGASVRQLAHTIESIIDSGFVENIHKA